LKEDLKKDLEDIKRDVEEKEEVNAEGEEGEEPPSSPSEEDEREEELKEEKSSDSEIDSEAKEESSPEEVPESTEEEKEPSEPVEEKPAEKAEESQRDKQGEDLLEEAESLVEELEKEPEEVKEPLKEPPKKKKNLLLTLGLAGVLILLLVGLALAVFFLWQAFSSSPVKKVKKKAVKTEVSLKKNLPKAKEEHLPEELAQKKPPPVFKPHKPKINLPKLVPTKVPPTTEAKKTFATSNFAYLFPYQLKSFLIPVGNDSFLDLKVTLYFGFKTKFQQITSHDVEYRKFVYFFAQKVPLKFWLSKKLRDKLEKALLKAMKDAKISPLPKKVKLLGVIYKS